jgi:dolichol-phosphate mannosyltransferase
MGTVFTGMRLGGRKSGVEDLLRFCVVGASGYLVNLSVYAVLIHAGVHYVPAAAGSFAVAFTNNYSWHRLWTFRQRRGDRNEQGLRFLLVSLGNLGANLLLLNCTVAVGVGKVPAEAIVSVLLMPLSFICTRVWAFRPPRAVAGG